MSDESLMLDIAAALRDAKHSKDEDGTVAVVTMEALRKRMSSSPTTGPPENTNEQPMIKVDEHSVTMSVRRALGSLPVFRPVYSQKEMADNPTAAHDETMRHATEPPLLLAQYLALLLHEAAEITTTTGNCVRLPECMYASKSKCIAANNSTIVPDHHLFMSAGSRRPRAPIQFMYPEEMKAMLCEQRQLPEPRPCLDCVRYRIENAYYTIGTPEVNIELESITRVMPFQVIYNCVGGYHRAYVHMPSSTLWKGIIPFPKLDVFTMKWDLQQRPHDAKCPTWWRRVQVGTVWQRPLLPSSTSSTSSTSASTSSSPLSSTASTPQLKEEALVRELYALLFTSAQNPYFQ